MKKSTPSVSQLEKEYEQLRQLIGQVGYISQGSVQDRTARKGGGAGYQWTRKVAQKTVTVSLSAEEFGKMKEAVANYRRLRKQLEKMEQLSRSIIFQSSSRQSRRKQLSDKVLGTN